MHVPPTRNTPPTVFEQPVSLGSAADAKAKIVSAFLDSEGVGHHEVYATIPHTKDWFHGCYEEQWKIVELGRQLDRSPRTKRHEHVRDAERALLMRITSWVTRKHKTITDGRDTIVLHPGYWDCMLKCLAISPDRDSIPSLFVKYWYRFCLFMSSPGAQETLRSMTSSTRISHSETQDGYEEVHIEPRTWEVVTRRSILAAGEVNISRAPATLRDKCCYWTAMAE